MIPKQELLKIATTTSLNPSIVEKDYVLGWMLAGIFNHNELAKSWVFKGAHSTLKCNTLVKDLVWGIL